MRRILSEGGAAMVMALVALAVLSAVGLMLLLSSSSEALIAGAFRDERSALHAADAIAARALDEIAAFADWNALLGGAVSASLADGPPSGTRTLADGSLIDLQQVVSMANCQKPSACTIVDVNAVTERRPWGARNPQWQLYAYGPMRNILPPTDVDPPWYVVLMVADDPLAMDDRIVLRAEAFGARNAHAVVEMLASRQTRSDYNDGGEHSVVTIMSWREVR